MNTDNIAVYAVGGLYGGLIGIALFYKFIILGIMLALFGFAIWRLR